jgi:hypothetical protein
MADVQTQETQKVRMQKGKITLGDIGAPALVKTLAPEQKPGGRYFVGRLYGNAVDFVERTNPKGNPETGQPDFFEGLRGNFIVVPSAPGMEELESGVLFIPDAFHNIIAAKLREAKKQDASASLDFAMNVYSIEAKNPAGYSWMMEPALPFVGKHPLADLMTRVSEEDRKRLAAPQKTVADQRQAAGSRK